MLAKYETAALTTPSTLHTPLRTTKPFRHIFIITGPAGCGKSSVANYLSQTLDLPYIEGDDVSSYISVPQEKNLTNTSSVPPAIQH
jgi:gluconokinase